MKETIQILRVNPWHYSFYRCLFVSHFNNKVAQLYATLIFFLCYSGLKPVVCPHTIPVCRPLWPCLFCVHQCSVHLFLFQMQHASCMATIMQLLLNRKYCMALVLTGKIVSFYLPTVIFWIPNDTVFWGDHCIRQLLASYLVLKPLSELANYFY